MVKSSSKTYLPATNFIFRATKILSFVAVMPLHLLPLKIFRLKI